MRIIRPNNSKHIIIGRLGDNDTTRVEIDVAKWIKDLGENGTWSALALQPTQTVPYIPTKVSYENNKFYWDVQAEDLTIEGDGKFQVIYTPSSTQRSVSAEYTTHVLKSLYTNDPAIPTPYESFYDNLVTIDTEVKASATSASNSATSASNSATLASGYATTATEKASEASEYATSASTSAGTATTKASEASASATTASTSATTATTKASEALASATIATTKASEASASATTATTKANEATESAEDAENSATIAASKANEASTSASNASINATASANSASNSASSATASANSATTASTKASEASNSASKALEYEESASTSASNAKTSESNAKTSETNAGTSATNAATSEANAKTYSESIEASAEQIATNKEDIITLKEESVERTGILADLSETSSANNSANLLIAINDAIEAESFVLIPAGEFVFTDSVVLPSNSLVRICGTSDAYSALMYRESVNNENHPIHSGSCLIFRGGNTRLFTNSGNVICELKNLMIVNEKSDKTYFQTGRVYGQETPDVNSKGKLYIENCCIAGFKSVAGSTEEKCCVLATRTRFSFCTVAIYNNIDGRIIDCSLNKCDDGFVFNEQSGFTTFSNTRIEWTTNTGISILTGEAHDITISACEFDACGKAGVYATNGNRLTIADSMFRRCGRTEDVGYDIDLTSINGLVLVGNNSVYKDISDSGSGVKKPDYCYLLTDCENVTNASNNWSGCANPQTDEIGEIQEDISELGEDVITLKEDIVDLGLSVVDGALNITYTEEE